MATWDPGGLENQVSLAKPSPRRGRDKDREELPPPLLIPWLADLPKRLGNDRDLTAQLCIFQSRYLLLWSLILMASVSRK